MGFYQWRFRISLAALQQSSSSPPSRPSGWSRSVPWASQATLLFAYASMAGLWPIFILHLLLLPMNAMRLRQAIFCRSPAARADAGHRQYQEIAFAAANDNQQASAQEIAISVGNLALKRPADFTCRQLDISADRPIGTSPVQQNLGRALDGWRYSKTSRSWMDAVTDVRRCDIAPWLFI